MPITTQFRGGVGAPYYHFDIIRFPKRRGTFGDQWCVVERIAIKDWWLHNEVRLVSHDRSRQTLEYVGVAVY